RHDDARAAGDRPDAGHDPGAGRLAVVHALGGEGGELEERGARVDEPLDPLACEQLAAGVVALDGLLAAAGADALEVAVELRDQAAHVLAIAQEVVGAGVEVAGDARHGQSVPARPADTVPMSARHLTDGASDVIVTSWRQRDSWKPCDPTSSRRPPWAARRSSRRPGGCRPRSTCRCAWRSWTRCPRRPWSSAGSSPPAASRCGWPGATLSSPTSPTRRLRLPPRRTPRPASPCACRSG